MAGGMDGTSIYRLSFSTCERRSVGLYNFGLGSKMEVSVLRKTVLASLSFLSATDIVVYVMILALVAVPFFLCEKAPDFVNGVHYVDLMDSLLHSHSYTTNFTPERLQPPGLSLILAFICTIVGCTHDILIRTMPVFLALGLLFSYEVVRRQRGCFIAAASCLLLAASPSFFPLVTSWISPTFPYFFISMVVLLLIPKLEASQRSSRTIAAVLLLCFFVTVAVMIESSGIALVAAGRQSPRLAAPRISAGLSCAVENERRQLSRDGVRYAKGRALASGEEP